MRKVALTAAALAAFLLVGCTHEVCTTIGNTTTCETQFKPSQAEQDKERKRDLYLLDQLDCMEAGQFSEQYCESQARRYLD